jgi:hypothetical protein
MKCIDIWYHSTHLHLVSTSSPQYVFMAWNLVKHRDNFIFTCTLPNENDLYHDWPKEEN